MTATKTKKTTTKKPSSSLYEHCTGERQTSKNVYIVAYVSGKLSTYGEWMMDTEEFVTLASAKKREKELYKNALNGKTSIRTMPKSKKERKQLQQNINKF